MWLFGVRSYSMFSPGAPIQPDWLWRSRKFFDWVRLGSIQTRRDPEGDLVLSPENVHPDARALRCWWVGLDIVTEGVKIPVYALVPWGRLQEVREALGMSPSMAAVDA